MLYFKSLYDGSNKNYPNGSKMLFVSLIDGTLTSTPSREKILYNHDNLVDSETVHKIGGLQDLKTLVHIKGSQHPIPIRPL
jgi:hypothetical protein